MVHSLPLIVRAITDMFVAGQYSDEWNGIDSDLYPPIQGMYCSGEGYIAAVLMAVSDNVEPTQPPTASTLSLVAVDCEYSRPIITV